MTTTSTQSGPSRYPGERFRVDPNGPEAHTDPVAVAVQHLVPYIGLRALLPVPNYQLVNGASRYWLFRQEAYLDEKKAELLAKDPEYLLVEIDAGLDGDSRIVRDARPQTEWESLKGLGQLAGFLPIWDKQNVDGASQYWVFHIKNGQLQCRNIQIKHDGAHTDTILRNDRPVDGDWTSLDGLGLLASIMPVPDKQNVDGASQYWVFSCDKDWRLMVRTISVKNGSHADNVIKADAPVTNSTWPAMDGVTQIAAVLQAPVPPTAPMAKSNQFTVLHFLPQWKLSRRVIDIQYISHTDTIVRSDAAVDGALASASKLIQVKHAITRAFEAKLLAAGKGLVNDVENFFKNDRIS